MYSSDAKRAHPMPIGKRKKEERGRRARSLYYRVPVVVVRTCARIAHGPVRRNGHRDRDRDRPRVAAVAGTAIRGASYRRASYRRAEDRAT